MATIERVEIFATGTWNGSTFQTEDLDEMVAGFEAEGQSGALPVKLGHTAPDTEPARGWLSAVWREGDKLLARVEQVPDDIIDGIKSGAWRHVSVELLRNFTTATGRTYRWLLDGLALLGAARPAVGVLQPLDRAVHRADGAECYTFAYSSVPDDAAALRKENEALRARLHRQSIDALVEGDVRAHVVMPAAREQFARLFRLHDDASYARVSPHDWLTFRATQPRPAPVGAATHPTGAAPRRAGVAPDVELVARTRAYLRENELRHFQLTGERLTFERAASMVVREVAQSEPTLLRGYIDQPGVID